jgi:hypothetical protein
MPGLPFSCAELAGDPGDNPLYHPVNVGASQ